MYTIQYDFCGNRVYATPSTFDTELEAKIYIDSLEDKTIEYYIVQDEHSLFGFKQYWENIVAKNTEA